jgi:hypothetical protein
MGTMSQPELSTTAEARCRTHLWRLRLLCQLINRFEDLAAAGNETESLREISAMLDQIDALLADAEQRLARLAPQAPM